MRLSSLSLLGLAALAYAAPRPTASRPLSRDAQGLFDESMEWMDRFYDREAGYLYDFSAAAALAHDTRSSVWYAFGLLARNARGDAAEADKIITNVVKAQYKDPAEQW